jgi:t-SNARE complex subunit (syntaxin)
VLRYGVKTRNDETRLSNVYVLSFLSHAILGVNHRTTYAKVAGKYQDVVTLEQSVAELHQMFLDFALLTEQQGELLDQIEYQVGQAADHVEVANEETYQAIEYQKAIRKKQWYVIFPWPVRF